MKISPDLVRLAELVRVHGYRNVTRAASYLWGVAKYIEAHDGVAPSSPYELGKWWHEPERTTQREGACWAKVTGGADVAVAARRFLADVGRGTTEEQNLIESNRLLLVPYML